MKNSKVKISQIIENQLPQFVQEQYPLASEFLSQYYKSLEGQGLPYDLIQNIDSYIKLDNITNNIEFTTTTSSINFFDTTIEVESTEGFPHSYGLLKIDDEIITYTGITSNSFIGCIRGFSGITSFKSNTKVDELVFSESNTSSHIENSAVYNLSILFLNEFYSKIKQQFLPGFENRSFVSGLNENIFIKQSKDFYSSKGTDSSFDILFKCLYGEEVEVIKPREFLIQPSDAQYRITEDIIVEPVSGDPENLVNTTLFQDEFQNISKAFGSISRVERIVRNNKDFYILSLDGDFDKDISVSGSIFGKFSIHPKTKLVNSVFPGSETLDVDSTVSFPNSGELSIIKDDGSLVIVTYTDKTLNQFLNCSGITESLLSGNDVSLNTVAYGFYEDEKIEVKITGVLSKLNVPKDNFYYSNNDEINIKTLGFKGVSFKDNEWIFNVSTTNQVKDLIPLGNSNYNIITYDFNNVYNGDLVEIDFKIPSQSGRFISTFTATVNQTHIPNISFRINAQENSFTDIEKIFSVRKLVAKYSDNEYTTNIQNIYKTTTESEELYIASSSIPKYAGINALDIQDYSVTFTFQSSNENNDEIEFRTEFGALIEHPFLTGDAIVYNPPLNQKLNLPKGVYIVKKIGSHTIKLGQSRADIDAERYVKITGNAVNNTFVLLKFANSQFNRDPLTSQKLIRKIVKPNNDGKLYDTISGTTGILINGVEILNYKSDDYVYYGSIESIEVLSPGDNYDVITPPILSIISNTNGSSLAEGICEIEGSLKRIDILDGGFDYIDEPTVTILGGSGVGAKAKANLVEFEHSVDFNSTRFGTVNLSSNIIGFTTNHRFTDGEKVVYQTNNQTSITGITTGSEYYVSVIGPTQVQLYSTEEDALNRISNRIINFSGYGNGNHTLKSTQRKKRVNSITIIDSGSGYKNREIIIPSNNIKIASNTIFAKDHRFSSGDILNYFTTGNSPSGLSEGRYYVTKINDDEFKLSEIGINPVESDFYYKSQKYLDIKTTGSGDHIFNYDPISVTVTGKVGVTTFFGEDYNCKVQPIFRGGIKSIFLKNNGVGYGSSDIVNFNKQPLFSFSYGKNAVVTPIISNGKIVQVVVDFGGEEYNCPPDLVIRTENGIGAILTPIIQDGKLSEVLVINGGFGYDKNATIIDVVSPPENAQLSANIKKWTINLYKRILNSNTVSDDGGVIYQGLNVKYGLQYTHLYCPNKLRELVFCKAQSGNEILYKPDLQNDEDLIKYHSPIIGWAYDGNPIYGPYGYSNPNGSGGIRKLLSGYKLSPETNQRPSLSLFSSGFFVEDYIYDITTGDLDEHNGRFCVTPEYPNGTYAYFITLNNLHNPEFPYFIGNTFKSKPINFNFDKNSNQDDFDLINNNLLRNTYPYNIDKTKSTYNFISNLDKIKNQKSIVKTVLPGSVDNIEIIFPGKDYKVGDELVFDNEGSGGSNANSKVSHIEGRKITEISCTTTEIQNVEFIPSETANEFIGFCSDIHNFKNNDLITISGVDSTATNLEGNFSVKIDKNRLILRNKIESGFLTGISTYFYVYGDLDFPYIRENDVYEIENEKIKIIGVDKQSSRIKVLRGYDDTPFDQHLQGSYLVEIPRKFKINIEADTRTYNFNREIYFNTQESLSIGNSVGIVSTILLSNPGVGITIIGCPTKTIYLPNHKIPNNTKLIYNSNSGISSVFQISTDGIDLTDPLENSVFYSKTYSDNLIELSLNKNQDDTLFYIGYGGKIFDHSFKTDISDVVQANVYKNNASIKLDTKHTLQIGDTIFLDCFPGITTTFTVKYDSFNERLILNQVSFNEFDIDIENNTINIPNHKYYNGKPLIYNSENISNLIDGSIYYAVVYDRNKIKLSETFYQSTLKNPETILINTLIEGTLSEINPAIDVIKNNKIIFDLSDSSLSKLVGSAYTSAFEFNIFTDINFTNKLVGFGVSNTFEVQKYGNIGIDSDSRLELTVNSNFPNVLYYNLRSIFGDNVISEDLFIKQKNSLNFIDSYYSGSHAITGVASESFDFNLYTTPEINFYSSMDGRFSYYTNSKNDIGGIHKVKLFSGGKSYKKLPLIKQVSSQKGSSALLFAESSSIGKIQTFKIVDIGFGYESDLTLKPTANLPQILKIEPRSTFVSVGISSAGINYNIAPDLIVLDGFTRQVINDVQLKYDLGDAQVTIIKNSKGFYNVTPIILPINNSNGYRIRDINYNELTELATVELNGFFDNPSTFPFSIGDKVLVENTNIIESEFKGYNSQEYGFALFEVVDVTINGEESAVIYSMDGYFSPGDRIGNYNTLRSAGRIIPEKEFPIFNINFVKNSFYENETVYSGNSFGIVQSWDDKNDNLKVTSNDIFIENNLIFGNSSKSVGNIKKVTKTETSFDVSSTSIVEKGWNRETGFLSNNLQRIHNNEYYQYFSYSLRSRIPYEVWKTPVDNLNHTSGFQKFSDLIIESRDLQNVGINTDQNEGIYISVNTLNSIVDLGSVVDYDLVFESVFVSGGFLISDQIIFNSAIIQDYSESIGNRVLLVDDISSEFVSVEVTGFVNSFPL